MSGIEPAGTPAPGPDRPPTRSKLLSVLLPVLLVAVLGGGVTVLVLGLATRNAAPTTTPAALPTTTHITSPTTSPTATGNPALDPEGPTAAPPVLMALQADGTPSAAAVQAAIAVLVKDPSLGGPVGVLVVDVASGATLADMGSTGSYIPASTTKLLTAAAALSVLGPDRTFETSVVSTAPGQLVLVGGGDPALSQRTASDDGWPYAVTPLATLADRTATALKDSGTSTVTLGYDATRFVGATLQESWSSRYVSSGDVGPITALTLDGGRQKPGLALRDADPPAYAAQQFAALLTARGIPTNVSGAASGSALDALTVASIDSPPVSDLVEQMLIRSDNDFAETLGRQVAAVAGQPASFAGAGASVEAALQELGVPTEGVSLADTSGLSRDNLVTPASLVSVVTTAIGPGHPELRSLLSGLPIGGFTGTLTNRFGSDLDLGKAGDIRAKTGYLRGVVTLAGYLRDADDQLLAFAFLASSVPPESALDAQATLDKLAVRLVECGCN